MYTDALLRVSNEQSIAAGTGTGALASTDHININTNQRHRDIGIGEPLYFLFTINTTFAGGTSVEFQVEVGTTNANGTTFTSVSTLSKRDFALATLVAGFQFVMPIPPHLLTTGTTHAIRAGYFRTGTFTSGAVSCDVVIDYQTNSKSYASGFTVA
jgi:hypothetical protein